MHEFSLVASIVEHASSVIASSRAQRVVSLKLRLGALSGANADALRFCFPHVARGTPLEGAELLISEPPLLLGCERCGAKTETRELELRCGSCRGDEVSVIAGKDLVVESMEVC